MKAILVLDKMPENCIECPLRFKDGDTDDWFRFRCHMSTDQIPKEGILQNCELKHLPIKQDTKSVIGIDLVDGFKDGWNYGWNACIDMILGEENE